MSKNVIRRTNFLLCIVLLVFSACTNQEGVPCETNMDCVSTELCKGGKCQKLPGQKEKQHEHFQENNEQDKASITEKDAEVRFADEKAAVSEEISAFPEELIVEERKKESPVSLEKQKEQKPETKTCPIFCRAHKDCNLPVCGKKQYCISGLCKEKKQAICPITCVMDRDCLVTGCGKKNVCNGKTNECVESEHELCPATCQSDLDCEEQKCGLHSVCKQGSCSKKVACEETCKTNQDCKSCHKNAVCMQSSYGNYCILQTQRSCPTQCQSSIDCRTSQCGDNTQCNPHTKRCYNPKKSGVCPTTCQSDNDCHHSSCGTRTHCELRHGATMGACRAPANYCPATCKPRWPGHNPCFSTTCAKRSYCSSSSSTCLPAAEICPSTCKTSADCALVDCGEKTTCHPFFPGSDTGYCTKKYDVSCRESCSNSRDCYTKGCGDRNFCSKGKCVRKENYCSDRCQSDNDCQKSPGCGKKSSCYFTYTDTSKTNQWGSCEQKRQGKCPSACQSNLDCFVDGCGKRLSCNYATGRCEETANLCSTRCESQADCAKNCGSNTTCSLWSKKCIGTCRGSCQTNQDCSLVACGKRTECRDDGRGKKQCFEPRKTGNCPSHCTSDHDCNVNRCGKKLFCNLATRQCVEPSGLCPAKCKKDTDCDHCGSKSVCSSKNGWEGTCIQPRDEVCPAFCSSHGSCTYVAGCGKKTACNLAINKCEEQSKLCPTKCSSDADCDASKCGYKTTCKSGTCQGLCPSECKSNNDCQGSGCGSSTVCAKHYSFSNRGVCFTPNQGNCPTTCKSNIDCLFTGCGQRTICHATKKVCVPESEECLYQCQSDADCAASKCGPGLSCINHYCKAACPSVCRDDSNCSLCTTGKTCLKAHPQATSGSCGKPTTGACPTSCKSSADCQVEGCKQKLYCNLQTKKCADTKELCPVSCSSNNDCPKSKCGSFQQCISGTCAK